MSSTKVGLLGLAPLLRGAGEGVSATGGGVEGNASVGGTGSGLDVIVSSLTAASTVNSSRPVTEACHRDSPPSVPNLFGVNHDERLFCDAASSVTGLLLSPFMEITGTDTDVSDRTIPSPLEDEDDGKI